MRAVTPSSRHEQVGMGSQEVRGPGGLAKGDVGSGEASPSRRSTSSQRTVLPRRTLAGGRHGAVAGDALEGAAATHTEARRAGRQPVPRPMAGTAPAPAPVT
jgi:hypothetical protein